MFNWLGCRGVHYVYYGGYVRVQPEGLDRSWGLRGRVQGEDESGKLNLKMLFKKIKSCNYF